MFTLIICKYLTTQIKDCTGKGLMAIFGMIGDLLLFVGFAALLMSFLVMD